MKNHLQPVTARANSRIKKSKVSPAKQSAQGDYEKGLEQKHIVKSETLAQGDNDNVKRSNRSEVTNVESKSNRRVQKVAGNDSGDKKGYKATLMTVKDPNKSGRLVVGSKGGYHEMGSKEGQKQTENFQRNFNKTKNK
tara:strand:+ start:46 stop:459 length:414 start_codon:yes stop_codon:yes gene_type:complete